VKEKAMQILRDRRNGVRKRAVRMLRESRDRRRALRARLKRVGLWLLLILGLNVFGWLVASSLIK
jgi:hypothetical protein